MQNIERTIAHLDLDSFFVSAERLKNSSLKGKPVIIGGMSDRGVVASCSYEARKYGVHSAMPIKMARALCGNAIFIKGDMELYSKYSNLVTEIIHSHAPLYEKTSIDEHYLDITGLDRFFGCHKWMKKLRRTIIKETGLPISFGLSINKTVSKIATGEAKPNGELYIEKPRIASFLAPLSIKKIPMIGEKTFTTLRSMGVSDIATLQQMPVDMMEKIMGKNGIEIWRRANGIDNTPVQPYWEQKSLSSEHTFQQDTTDTAEIKNVLTGMVEKLSFELRSQQKLTACITVKIRYSNFDTHTHQKRIPYTSFDHVISPIVNELFEKLYKRRMLIRLVGVRLSQLVQGTQQLNLFESTPEMVNLYSAVDLMKRKFGKQALTKAVNL